MFAHGFEMISYGSMIAGTVIVFIFRKCWRRGKPLQEP